MSTRSEVYIKANGETVRFYHHCDGYYEGVGFDLAQKILEIKQKFNFRYCLGTFINSLLSNGYELSMDPAHDIEYAYDVIFDRGSEEVHVLGGPARYVNGKLQRYEQKDMLKMLSDHIAKHNEGK